MKTLHVAPGDSAGGSLLQAIRDAGRDDEVLRFRDDLSCGPIDSDEPSARAIWWRRLYDVPETKAAFGEFWERVTTTDARLIVWFGRHSARELAFFLAWVDRLGERPYQIIDVTGLRSPLMERDSSTALFRPIRCVSIMQPDALKALLGTEQPITRQEKDKSAKCWRRLRGENAAFRIVTETGLASTSIDYFDPLLLAQATPEWQRAATIVGNVMGSKSDRYLQAGDLVLQERVDVLVDEGRLLADGDPWTKSYRVRLPSIG